MDKALRPDKFDVSASNNNSAKEFKHWLKTFEYYLEVLPQSGLDKLCVLTNYVSPTVYECFSECNSYQSALEILKSIYIKPTNEVFARHLLAIRRQQVAVFG